MKVITANVNLLAYQVEQQKIMFSLTNQMQIPEKNSGQKQKQL